MRHRLQAEGRLAHFADTFAQGTDMLGTIMRVQTEAHFQFVDWFGSQAVVEDLVEAFERVVVALEPGDAILNREAVFHGLVHRADTSQAWEILVGTISAHSDNDYDDKANGRREKLDRKLAMRRAPDSHPGFERCSQPGPH